MVIWDTGLVCENYNCILHTRPGQGHHAQPQATELFEILAAELHRDILTPDLFIIMLDYALRRGERNSFHLIHHGPT